MRKLMSCALLVAGAGLSTSASAEFYVGGLGHYFSPDSDRDNTDDGYGARTFVGIPVGERGTAFELSLFGNLYEPEQGTGENTQFGVAGDVMIPFTEGKFRPFGLLGFGFLQEEYFGDEKEVFTANAGLGALIRILPAMDLRIDGRYQMITENVGGGESPMFDLMAGVGVMTYFGGSSEPPPPPPPAECVDSDGDGVCDEADLCPGTEPGVMVDAKGCPIVEEEPLPEANQDLGTVYFEFDQSELSSQAMSTLDGAAATIDELVEAYPDLKVEVSGHTDWIGTDGYNQGLSERRANTAKNYLVRKGVDSSRISVYAYGESRPVAPNANPDGSDNPEGRAQNRRAEVKSSAQ